MTAACTKRTRTATSGVPGHDYSSHSASFAYRGNLSRLKRWKTGTTYLTTVYNYDDLGNIRSVADPRGYTTSFGYTDSWQGAQCLPTANAQAYMTEATNALNHRTQIRYHPCTGLRYSQKDENQILASNAGTVFTFDLMGRPTQVDFADGGRVTTAYADTPPATITRTTKITSTLNRVETTTLDDIGRPILAKSSNGTLWDWTRTEYDAKGRVSRVSNPLTNATAPAVATFAAWTNYAYDGLGRTTTVIHQDDTASVPQRTTYAYSGNATTVADPAGRPSPETSRTIWPEA